MGFQSKTYSLSDEVVAAIEAARSQGLTPNKYLRYLIGLDGKDSETIGMAVAAKNETNARDKTFPPLSINDAVRRERKTRGPRPKGDKTR